MTDEPAAPDSAARRILGRVLGSAIIAGECYDLLAIPICLTCISFSDDEKPEGGRIIHAMLKQSLY